MLCCYWWPAHFPSWWHRQRKWKRPTRSPRVQTRKLTIFLVFDDTRNRISPVGGRWHVTRTACLIGMNSSIPSLLCDSGMFKKCVARPSNSFSKLKTLKTRRNCPCLFQNKRVHDHLDTGNAGGYLRNCSQSQTNPFYPGKKQAEPRLLSLSANPIKAWVATVSSTRRH